MEKSTEVKGAKYRRPCFMTPVSMKHTEHGHPQGHKVSQGAPGHKREGKYDCLVGTSAGLVLLHSDENVLELSNC